MGLMRLTVLLTFITLGSCQMPGMPGMGGGKKDDKVPAVKEDLKYIRCGVCDEIAKTLHREVKKMREDMPRQKKLMEVDIIEKIEKICDPDTKSGTWIKQLDMLEDGRKIKLVHHEKQSKCGSECRTIARACEEIIGDVDTDVGEVLYKGEVNRAKLREILCTDLTDACESASPKVPKSRKAGPEFVEMSDEEISMADMMANMKDIPGMPGMSMYNRDDLAGMMEGYGGGEGGYGGYGEDGGYGGGYGDYDDADEGAEDADRATQPGQSAGFGMTEKVFEAVDTATEAVSEGIVKAATVVGETVGKISSMASGMFSGKEERKGGQEL